MRLQSHMSLAQASSHRAGGHRGRTCCGGCIGDARGLEAEADAPIQNLGVGAYEEARRQEREANDLAMMWYWSAVALAVVRKMSNSVGFDPATRMAVNDFARLLEEPPSPPHPPLPETRANE